MNPKLLIISSHFLIIHCILLLLNEIPICSSFYLYETCSNKFRCGDTEAEFPFWGEKRPEACGHRGLKLDCERDKSMISIMNVKYRILDLNQESQTLKIARADFKDGLCSPKNVNTSLDEELFEYAPMSSTDITLVYGCSSSVNFYLPTGFECPGEKGFVLIGNPGSNGAGSCRLVLTVRVPISDDGFRRDFANNVSAVKSALEEGFVVKYKVDDGGRCDGCKESGGVCGYDWNANQTTCYCPKDDGSISGATTCSSSQQQPGSGGQVETNDAESDDNRNDKKSQVPRSVGLSIAGACIFGIIIGGLTYYYIQRRKRQAAVAKSKDVSTQPSSKSIVVPSTNFIRSTPSRSSYTYSKSKSDIEKGSTYFGAQVFSYTELEEATENFDSSRELGEGGFGTVYYGQLRDGRVVAVKRLYENSFKRVEQFMNEVEILTRLRHQNLVKLYGCTSRRSRELLLVYEFIPNGTVADHLHGKQSESGPLSWPVRLSIAIETADALAYLHRTDIIHRDVKTNNILLDSEFRVKVADFGLSKLFPTDVTHVSTAPQGTPGYVDPEYYQSYRLTTKSDVYSFGVVLIELISSLQAVDTNRHRHDINLANMAINKIQNHLVNELVDPSLGFDRDENVKKMATDMAELAFRCLQQERDMRPSMEEVLAALRAIRDGDRPVDQRAEVVDIRSEDVGLLRNLPPPLSPDSGGNDKWNSNTHNSY